MTHLYTLLVAGTVLTGSDDPPATAIAWAHDTVLAIGTDEAVSGISRGDSWLVDLGGATVVPLGPSGDVCWPPEATLAVGGGADLVVLEHDPRAAAAGGAGLEPLAVVRSGRVVAGRLPGADPGHDGRAGHDHGG